MFHAYLYIFLKSYSSIACLGTYWIGVKDMGQNGIWKWASDATTAGIYIRKVSALTFYNAQPDNWQNNEHCLYLIYGYVNDVDCTSSRYCLCEKPGIELITKCRGWMWRDLLLVIQSNVQLDRSGVMKIYRIKNSPNKSSNMM